MLKGFSSKPSFNFLTESCLSVWVLIIIFMLVFVPFGTSATVILQYHHVSEDTPKSTSIAPAQFTKHLQYLKDNHFNVVPLSTLVNALKNQQPIADKTVVITFDDAYQSIFTHAKPLLEQFNYPYTIFINPSTIVNKADTQKANSFLSWQQIKTLSDEGVIIANHGFTHDSIARVPAELNEKEWLLRYEADLLKSEQIIKEKTGQSWRYFAYPYGEYTVASQALMTKNNFVAFTQQSGAVGLSTDSSIIPRFPASQPYDKINRLRDKINALPLTFKLSDKNKQTIFTHKTLKEIEFTVQVEDFNKNQLACYVSGLGKQTINWQSENTFSITFSSDLPTGRVRCNCTAPSISKPGRYYWYSKPWFILKADNQWYNL